MKKDPGLSPRIISLACLLVLAALSSAALGHKTKQAQEKDGCNTPSRNDSVLAGIDVLERQHFSMLKDLAAKHGNKLRLGIMTNHSGLDMNGRRTVDVLYEDAAKDVPGLAVTTLFSPEHGFFGAVDTTNIPSSSTDTETKLPIISLYGATPEQRHPSVEQLKDLDAVVIDLQDAGVRFYTYETVIGYFLETASKTQTDIIVLDRPNPVGGVDVQGPVSTAGRENYINYMPIPVRHGMTMGELATFFNAQKHLNAQLHVVRMSGWQRSDWFDETSLMWTNPSPNLRSMTATTLYPGLGELERTNISVGRGTDTPFHWIGAPWVDGRKLADYLNNRSIPGVRFLAIHFTPTGKYPYNGQICQGVEVLIMNRTILNSPELGIEVASALWKLYPEQYKVDAADRLLLNQSVVDAIKSGSDPHQIAEGWRTEQASFLKERARALLY
jgi:uncharacterized protein YbbC (DUF1343 family)